MKTCTKCKVEKDTGDFYNDKSKKDSLRSLCKICYKKYSQSWKGRKCQKKYRESEKGKKLQKKYHQTKKYKEYSRSKYRKEYRNNKYLNDIQFKLGILLRTRLSIAIRNNQKVGSAIKDLGCTIPELVIHLEKQFLHGMSWNNHSYNGWHIDHIKALANFDLTDREQLLEAVHYSNLQPKWAVDNLRKWKK